ncbi:MAG: hypothetical protein ACRC5C_14775, partial [Bacilli bacterium]
INRQQFFSEMKNGLFGAVKEFMTPIVQEDIEKISDWAEDASGLDFHPVSLPFPIDTVHLQGKPVLLFNDKGTLKAYVQTCSKCHSIYNYISYSKSLKCFHCDEEHSLEGENTLMTYITKQKESKWYVGIPR